MECPKGHRLADDIDLMSYVEGPRAEHESAIAIPSHDSEAVSLASTSPEVNFPAKLSKFSPREQQAVHLEQFRWDKLLTNKVPEPHQLLAFVSAMLADTIVILPTGSGKTLIASMLFSWMAQANPGRVGLMVVQRVPLMQQQTAAIAHDTGLKVASFGGVNITRLRIEQVFFLLTCQRFLAIRHNLAISELCP